MTNHSGIMNWSKQSNNDRSILTSNVDLIAYSILFITIEAVFLNRSLQIICGPVIAILFAYLYFVKKKTVLVSLFIVLANDSLGTVFLGKISFQYLLIVFIAYELIQSRKVPIRSFALSLLAIVMCLQPYITGVVGIKNVIYTFAYILILLCQYQKYNKDDFAEQLMISISLIVCLIAIHTLITGGVVYAEAVRNEYYQEYQRRGVLGVGIGDPNFSSLLLCTGIVCTINNNSFHWVVKLIMTLAMTAAMFVTLSTSGLIAFVIVMLLSAVVNKNLSKGLRKIVIVVLVALTIFQCYLAFPQQYRNADVDAYIDRIEVKYNALVHGDMYSLTTGRTGLSDQYWAYINGEQSLLKQLFGGNSVIELGNAAHNTYISYILQYGYLGAAGLIAYLFIRFSKAYFMPKDDKRKINLILKALYGFFIFTISVFDGSTFAMTFVILFLF